MTTLFTTSQLATANKGALRSHCREHGIAATALNVDGMREALAPFATDYSDANAVAAADATIAAAMQSAVDSIDGAEVSNVPVEPVEPYLAPVAEVLPPTDFAAVVSAASSEYVATTSRIGEVATIVPRTAADVFAANPKPVKAARVRTPREPRDEANGVKRPAANTLCGKVWGWCDEQVAAGVRPEAAALREALATIDPTTCTVQYYRWRKFNGIRGR